MGGRGKDAKAWRRGRSLWVASGGMARQRLGSVGRPAGPKVLVIADPGAGHRPLSARRPDEEAARGQARDRAGNSRDPLGAAGVFPGADPFLPIAALSGKPPNPRNPRMRPGIRLGQAGKRPGIGWDRSGNAMGQPPPNRNHTPVRGILIVDKCGIINLNDCVCPYGHKSAPRRRFFP